MSGEWRCGLSKAAKLFWQTEETLLPPPSQLELETMKRTFAKFEVCPALPAITAVCPLSVSLLPALASFYTCLLVCLWGAVLPPFIFYLYRLAAKSWTYLQKLSAVGFKFDKWFQMEFEIKWIFKNLKSEWMFLYILRSMINFTIIIFTSKCNESVAHLKMNHAII